MSDRLQKYLSHCGVASRRKAEEFIAAGRVKVNGVVVTQPGSSVSEGDKVLVDGKPVKPADQKIYYFFNKPKGIITTSDDEQGRKTVIDFLPKSQRVVACGRLDAASRGLVILTNDGDLCFQLTHPKYEHEKEYQVEATINNGPAIEERFDKLERGIKLDDGMTAPAKIKDVQRTGMRIKFTIIIHEGKNRQVRRMCSAVGFDVVDLFRSRVGKAKLGNLPAGKWKLVKREDII
jgi:23S rRNA pseudouridine2605 synthase